MEIVQIVLTCCSLIISLATIGSLIYAFSKFLSKPRDTLETRVSVMEMRLKEIERDEYQLDIRCKEQDETNEVLIHACMALIAFEVEYCLTEKRPLSDDLKKAKTDLNHYLAHK